MYLFLELLFTALALFARLLLLVFALLLATVVGIAALAGWVFIEGALLARAIWRSYKRKPPALFQTQPYSARGSF